VSADLERLTAAQAKADQVVRKVADHDGSDAPRLLVTVVDQETNTRLASGFVTYQLAGQAPAPGTGRVVSPAERELLTAVLEALTLPFDADGYEKRMVARADWVRCTLKGVLEEGDLEWHADWLRRKLRDEEARHAGGAL
jgi:hypothetical protein